MLQFQGVIMVAWSMGYSDDRSPRILAGMMALPGEERFDALRLRGVYDRRRVAVCRYGCWLLSILALSACSSIDVTRVKPDDYHTKGFRYWSGMPYLLVRAPVEVARTDSLFLYERNGEAAKKLTAVGGGFPGAGGDGRPSPASGEEVVEYLAEVAAQGEKGGSGQLKSGPEAIAATKTQGRYFAAAENGDQPRPPDGEDPPPGPGAIAAPVVPYSRPEAREERPVPTPIADVVAIVYLPDYCHQYAVHPHAVWSKVDAKVSLKDGWALDTSDSKLNATDVLTAVVGAVAAVKGAPAQGQALASGGGDTGGGGSAPTPQSWFGSALTAPKIVLRKTVTTYLKPGLYALVADGPCEARRTFDIQALKYETSETWSELKFSPDAAGGGK